MTSRPTTGHRVGRMVSLGRIAAPKPINLPSQRRENNGNDPNINLVPRGQHTWTSPGEGAGNSALVNNPSGGDHDAARV
eukprot:CAMPEP_0197601496 /NCGR_PEP_ID=MMETSP1326-20131121/35402_1 /TAXON_ID=1155430 /ORGANISM="Genus nov. species nov., Strain RCC2288" /LENGTH=78 /DNA_ID=CAMNT_0043168729 /DNA_START=399 /DNA_END=631 /DNA_ORIENTATION=-